MNTTETVSLTIRSALHVAVAFLLLHGTAASASNTDWQLWLDQSVTARVNDDTTIRLKQQERWVDDVDDLRHYHAELDLTHQWQSWLALGAQYRQQYVRRGKHWNEENRPVLTATFKGRVQDVAWKNRNRFEFRFRDGRDTLLSYRNQTVVQAPFSWTEAKIRPYMFDEIFIDSDQGELNRNRLVLGVKGAPATPLRVDVYLMWETVDTGPRWADAMILGGRVGLNF